MLNMEGGKNLPGWRDFERSVAIVFEGEAQESKYVFDVVVPSRRSERPYGISCKMRGELYKAFDRRGKKQIFYKGRVSMEMANAAKAFWNTIKARGIDEATFRENPMEAGIALVTLIKTWHNYTITDGIDLSRSFYLVLEWDGVGNKYQLFQYVLELPDPKTLSWYFPVETGKDGKEKPQLRLVGKDEFGTVFEWYSGSGGQLKYYPLTEKALWRSDSFQLEPLPNLNELEYGIVAKAKTYFPVKWSKMELE